MISLKDRILSPSHGDLLWRWLLTIVALITGVIVVVITVFLFFEASVVLEEVGWGAFFRDPSWHPREQFFNLMPMLLGTLSVTVGAVFLAIPLGIGSAIFAQYYAPHFVAYFYRQLIELLAGIPSVVYGFWGLVVLVPLINRFQAPGTSLLAGIIILTLMILPTVALTAEASFEEVPLEFRQGAIALGLSKWAMIRGVILPVAKSGVMTGFILATGRALGETMAVLMVCGNVVQVPDSFFAPVRTLTANIALEMAYATGNHRSALFVSGLWLMGAIALMVLIAEVVRGQNVKL
ncbi:phosphate ABC transporter permease subunit PstC [Cyanobacterium sp. IPPAS B-1200]|uniref:phosphate ABC transporter permease subunit PstC n=1 Tax=Cyanobacterium sp. IPPAS B-1200 TaxID=1562720 RepID=UPI00085275B0|nr:phosphate ABC transporter permease subunit PstC [Cyanobacterium sp. IPPAS B-1200]OEJ79467.1 phosphate ABC transporter permease subunit PstC [Cyanobacterium sp. IPPAS B-1200]